MLTYTYVAAMWLSHSLSLCVGVGKYPEFYTVLHEIQIENILKFITVSF